MNNIFQSSYAPPPSKWAQLKAEIKEVASSLGIDDVGFTTAEPFLYLKNILQDHRDKGYDSGFEEADLDKRTIPALSSGDKPLSIISIAVAYPSKMENPPKSEPGARRGILARTSWGQDYHHVLREALGRLEDFIRERVPEAILESMVDTGVLVDRAVAERAGIGFSGKNCAVISPKWGSWIYLGEMVTNIPFPPDQAVEDGCGDCTKCLDACPTGALVGPGQLNAQACISYLTQTKGFLSEEYMTKIGNRLYGCDTCQVVCPINKGKSWNHRPQMLPDPEIVKPLLMPILDLSNRELKERFGSKEASAVPKLIEIVLKETRPEMRGTAAWALGKIGGSEALAAIELALEREEHDTVMHMLSRAQNVLLNNKKAQEN